VRRTRSKPAQYTFPILVSKFFYRSSNIFFYS